MGNPEGFPIKNQLLLVSCVNRNLLAVTTNTLKLDNTVNFSKESIIRTTANIVAWVNVCSTLLYENVASENCLTVCTLCAKTLRLRFTTVVRTTLSFL